MRILVSHKHQSLNYVFFFLLIGSDVTEAKNQVLCPNNFSVKANTILCFPYLSLLVIFIALVMHEKSLIFKNETFSIKGKNYPLSLKKGGGRGEREERKPPKLKEFVQESHITVQPKRWSKTRD